MTIGQKGRIIERFQIRHLEQTSESGDEHEESVSNTRGLPSKSRKMVAASLRYDSSLWIVLWTFIPSLEKAPYEAINVYGNLRSDNNKWR